MTSTPPTVAQFKAQFPRDWPYGSGTDTVTDADVQAAINEAYPLFNPRIWNSTVPSFSATVTGDTTLNSATITAIPSTAGFAPGQSISGAGIPGSATIQLVGTSSVVISANATATATGVTLVVGGATGITVSEAVIAYCYLAAHLMVLSLQNAGGLSAVPSFQGAGSSGGGVVSGKAVGSVSLTYELPEYVKNSASLSQYLRTGYGQKYLQMLAPKIPGRRVMVVGGEPTVVNPSNPPNSLFPV